MERPATLRTSRSGTDDDLLSPRYPLVGCPLWGGELRTFGPQRSARCEVQAVLLAEPSRVEPSHLDVPHRGVMPVIEDHPPFGLGISARYGGDRGAERPIPEPRDHLHNKQKRAFDTPLDHVERDNDGGSRSRIRSIVSRIMELRA